jgi:siroheme synthase
VQSATRGEQRLATAPLDALAARMAVAGIASPAILVIGEVARAAALASEAEAQSARPIAAVR